MLLGNQPAMFFSLYSGVAFHTHLIYGIQRKGLSLANRPNNKNKTEVRGSQKYLFSKCTHHGSSNGGHPGWSESSEWSILPLCGVLALKDGFSGFLFLFLDRTYTLDANQLPPPELNEEYQPLTFFSLKF